MQCLLVRLNLNISMANDDAVWASIQCFISFFLFLTYILLQFGVEQATAYRVHVGVCVGVSVSVRKIGFSS